MKTIFEKLRLDILEAHYQCLVEDVDNVQPLMNAIDEVEAELTKEVEKMCCSSSLNCDPKNGYNNEYKKAFCPTFCPKYEEEK